MATGTFLFSYPRSRRLVPKNANIYASSNFAHMPGYVHHRVTHSTHRTMSRRSTWLTASPKLTRSALRELFFTPSSEPIFMRAVSCLPRDEKACVFTKSVLRLSGRF